MGSVRTIVQGQGASRAGLAAAGDERPAGWAGGTAAELATVTVLPVARHAGDDPGRAAAAGVEAGSAGRAVRPVPPAQARRARTAEGSPPRPVACDRSDAPDLHGSRLTVRGRVVVGVVWAVLIVAMAVMIAQPAEPPAPAETTTIVVRPGDTLWGLAGDLVPGADRRVTVDQITELNGLRSVGEIRPGEVLVVPAGASRRSDAP